ncbi:hypothetical protein K505DRAFT_253516 [Melanomma pulvis-pyrius CBS 109.77]|uniref:NAD dependent epimerase/dehydratase n=1 Tax=Melanomma pulvis-pyrius CBS 109.77 TaxID=1314802 RepID=A0A6A6WYQ6_9PLEO|nr:hypothetical protein K505DRAFT_253516 [Melanomma pulvis-pyrius CBS 109.77]
MAGQRLIDADERVRTKPMRILVLGMCRTGTTSISTALRKLGYTPHHMREVLVHPSEIPLWQEAVNTTLLPPSKRPAKQRNAPPYARAEFDKLLGDYDVVADLPGAAFATQLIEAYPEAKVILTNRDFESWEKSMQNSIWQLFTWKLFDVCRILNLSQMAPVMRLLHPIFYAHNGNHYGGPVAREAYEKHYENVRALVPKERLLEFGPESDWESLCQYLDRAIPKEKFPHMDENKAMETQILRAWRGMVQYVLLMVVLPGSVTVVAILLYYWQEQILGFVDGEILEPLREFMKVPKN